MAIREDLKGRIILTGLNEVPINSAEDLLNALNFGSSIRQTDATAMNAKSSRSHAVFSLNLVQRQNKAKSLSIQEKRFSVPVESIGNMDDWVTTDSKFHFVDLAGSEKLKNTQASGDRAKEGISINAGLTILGKVISQLSTRQGGSHVSYRDSKLTRLLQDSLGGNAITYMVACITPAEFHLSETINTVQYAQRARAIQSKPQIQQIFDDSDKQATIDRLRAEISFLREQIRGAERDDQRNNTSHDRSERQNEIEIELQNHLLDVQESYTALSHRHAKLISEISKARDQESDTPILSQTIGESAAERLKRSNLLNLAVDRLVSDHEMTIQRLESSLSQTKSSLASTESALSERESRCAHTESVNQHLQSRLQKLLDRDSSTENYLRDLEVKLDGYTSGEEKNSVLISELRKEIARVRENEASCEDYISTLEERLAEADQDMEMMQREVDRLEHVVERQRSLGKLDDLLYEFDQIQQKGRPTEIKEPEKPLTNGFSKHDSRSRSTSDITLEDAVHTAIPESDDENLEEESSRTDRSIDIKSKPEAVNQKRPKFREVKFSDFKSTNTAEASGQTPQQSNAVAEKLDGVTHELFELKVEHESTLSEFEMMSSKYEEALRKLAELQDIVDEARYPAPSQSVMTPVSTRPSSFLGPAKMSELRDGPLSSSRSLSSELSLVGESANTVEMSSNKQPSSQGTMESDLGTPHSDESLVQHLHLSRNSEREKDQTISLLEAKLAETNDIVEELKTEVQKTKMMSPTTPTDPVIRRKSSLNFTTIDRAHRSLASLKNIAVENLEDKPDTMQNFELNLNTAMHELHQRSERVQVLEAEISRVKKEMEGKVAMISGLTRERSSLKASSPMDISVVANMHEKLLESQNEVKLLQEKHAERENDLAGEVESLREALTNLQSNRGGMPGIFPETPAAIEANGKQLGDQGEEIVRLQDEIRHWQEEHKAATHSAQESERNFHTTIADLETSMANVEIMHQKRLQEVDGETERNCKLTADFEQERAQHAAAISTLQSEITQQKTSIQDCETKLSEMGQAYTTACEQLEEGFRYRTFTEEQLVLNRDHAALLSKRIEDLQSDVEFHKHGLKSLHDSHAKDLDELRTKSAAESADMARQKEDLIKEHQHALGNESKALNEKVDELSSQLEEQVAKCAALEKEKSEITASMEKTSIEMSKIREERDTATRLVSELEDQLTQSYDQQRATSSRLSILSANRDQALQDALTAKSKLEEDLEAFRHRLEQADVGVLDVFFTQSLLTTWKGQMRANAGQSSYERSNSLTSNLRKSTSATSLPSSPPPAIPLPPLPTQTTANNVNNGSTSPMSAHEFVSVQYAEDQEARIRTIEKHLFAEKQLTATLEEALVDLEHQGSKTKGDLEAWKKKCWTYEDELTSLKKERNNIRHSVQAVEEERHARREAEAARAHLEERMSALQKKKKKSGFNCF